MKYIIISFGFALLGLISNAQEWHAVKGISAKVNTIIHYNADTLLAGVDNEGIFISYDRGMNWNKFALSGKSVYSLFIMDTYILAGTRGDNIFRGTIINDHWENIQINQNVYIRKFSLHKDILYACAIPYGGPAGIYYSQDKGLTWTLFVSAPPWAYLDIDFNENGRAFIATPSGTFYTDKSAWLNTTGYGGTFWSVKYMGNNTLLYGTDIGVWISTDNGVSAEELGRGVEGKIYHLKDTFYVAGYNGIYYSPVAGTDWINLNLAKVVFDVLTIDGKLLAATEDGVYFISNKTTPVTTINKLTNSSGPKIFPNPVKDMMYIENNSNDRFYLEIFGSGGQLILKNNNIQAVDLSSYTSGIYYYRISTKEQTFVGKIVKE